jgi:hypothetical protein
VAPSVTWLFSIKIFNYKTVFFLIFIFYFYFEWIFLHICRPAVWLFCSRPGEKMCYIIWSEFFSLAALNILQLPCAPPT